MATLLFPLQFKRQYSGPLDADNVFTLTTDRTTYLTNPLRYAGQIVFDTQDTTLYYLNSSLDTWISIATNTSLSALSSVYFNANTTTLSALNCSLVVRTISAANYLGIPSGGTGIASGAYLPLSGGQLTGAVTSTSSISAQGIIYTLAGNSSQWQTTYTTVCANSASWIKSTSTLETPTTGISTISNIISLSQTTYDALTIKRPDTFYIII